MCYNSQSMTLDEIISHLKSFTPSDYAAWYGALIASVALLTPIFRDRTRVRVKFHKNQKIHGYPAIPSNKVVCTIEVVNLGKQPVSLSKVGLYLNILDKPVSLFSESLTDKYPKILTPEQPKTEIPALQEGLDLSEIIYVWAEDRRGKEYRKYLSKIPTIKLFILWLRKKFRPKK